MSEKPLRILIADDQPYIRRAVRALLESRPGWEVCGEASDGREAIRKTDELQPDIIVMDMFMRISMAWRRRARSTARIAMQKS